LIQIQGPYSIFDNENLSDGHCSLPLKAYWSISMIFWGKTNAILTYC